MRARVVAPLLAAVLGIGGGVATALVVPDDADAPDTSSFNDPLRLDIPLVDQADCSGESLLVVGYGDTAAPLSSAVANSGAKGLRYLTSERSCPTVLGPEGKPVSAYVVYRGPYETKSEPCAIRMSGVEAGSFVTVLRSGNEQLVKCPCEIPAKDAPLLEVGMATDQESTLWVRGLQAMFNDDDPQAFPRSAISGVFDAFTSARVREYQDNAPGQVTVAGAVDAATWNLLQVRLCRNYDY